jgi:hypothetical protein
MLQGTCSGRFESGLRTLSNSACRSVSESWSTRNTCLASSWFNAIFGTQDCTLHQNRTHALTTRSSLHYRSGSANFRFIDSSAPDTQLPVNKVSDINQWIYTTAHPPSLAGRLENDTDYRYLRCVRSLHRSDSDFDFYFTDFCQPISISLGLRFSLLKFSCLTKIIRSRTLESRFSTICCACLNLTDRQLTGVAGFPTSELLGMLTSYTCLPLNRAHS